MKSYICGIGTANPPNKMPQMQVADFMAAAHQLAGERLGMRFPETAEIVVVRP